MFQNIVKVHRVFPSSYKIIASSQLIQLRKANIGDSEAVVTPFMQDGIYPPRNFATLGPSGLRPPFTGVYIFCLNKIILPCSTGQVSDSIHILNLFAESYVFIKQSPLPFFCYYQSFLSRSYKVILPSSFNIFYFYALIL